jgi:hypothetical protein
MQIAQYKTKKALKEAVAKDPKSVLIVEPSIMGEWTKYLTEIPDNLFPLYVTNHPKRSWFASIKKKIDGTFVVA